MRARKSAIVDLQRIRFGRCIGAIYRRTDIEHGSWFFRTHLRQEKRYYRVSLKTSDREEALQRAQDVMVTVLAKVESGTEVLKKGVQLPILVGAFTKHLHDQVKSGQLRESTEKMQLYRVRIGLEFLKEKYVKSRDKQGAREQRIQLSDIEGSVFKDYLSWRQAKVAAKRVSGTIRRDVVRDELMVIRKMFKYGIDQKLCSQKQLPIWDFKKEKEVSKRRRINHKQVQTVFNLLNGWSIGAAEIVDDYHRQMTLHIMAFALNSGLRSGEIFGLRNKDIEIENKEELTVTVRAEISKVGKQRVIIVRLYEMVRFWFSGVQRFSAPNDFLFSSFESGSISARDSFYHAFAGLKPCLQEKNLGWFGLYYCRHWYITERLLAGESIHLVAKAAGTSANEIERTYSNVLTEMVTQKFNEKIVDYKDGRAVVSKAPKVGRDRSGGKLE